MKKLVGYQKGVNLGGWLSQGPLDETHIRSFIKEENIKQISKWGCDHLRLPLDFENVEDEEGNDVAIGYEHIDKCVEWCRKYNLNIVLDLHKTIGYIFDDYEYSANFFKDEKLQGRFLGLWDKLSKRYAKDSDIMMFELLNEVTSFDYIDAWNELGTKAVNVIRKNAPTAKILFGGVGYSAVNAVKYLPVFDDENIVYNIHCYEPLLFTHQGAHWVDSMPLDFRIEYPGDVDYYMKRSLEIAGCQFGALHDKNIIDSIKSLGHEFFEVIFEECVKVADERNVALYCGEYGVIDLADPESTLRWYKDINYIFKKYGIGRCAWNYKMKDFGLEGEHYSSVINELIKYL